MGVVSSRTFTCHRCGNVEKIDNLTDQPRFWGAVQFTRPPLAEFASERAVLCGDCIEVVIKITTGEVD